MFTVLGRQIKAEHVEGAQSTVLPFPFTENESLFFIFGFTSISHPTESSTLSMNKLNMPIPFGEFFCEYLHTFKESYFKNTRQKLNQV
jgi:hypothetical protein